MIFFLLSLLTTKALAQTIDPSVLTFVEKTSQASQNTQAPANSDSDRYVRKTSPKVEKKSATRKTASVDEETDDGSGITADEKAPPMIHKKTSLNEAPSKIESSNEANAIEMKSFLLGGSTNEVEEYKSRLDSEDERRNTFQLRFAVDYFKNESVSNYAFRQYQTSGPAALIGVDCWLSPFFGFSGNYQFSFMNQIPELGATDNSLKANHSWYDLGLRFRRFSSLNPTASAVTFALNYLNYDLKTSADSSTRMRQSVKALDIGASMSVPTSKKFAWVFGANVRPLANHTEAAANANVSSGAGNDTMGLGAHLGADFRISRESKSFVRFKFDQWRSQFTGAASTIDPSTGLTPSNVNATNNFYMLEFGFSLGR